MSKFTLLTLILTSILLSCAPAAAEAAPKVSFAETLWEFGEIEQGAVISKTFAFSNLGDADLFILDVQSTCGCTVPSVPKAAVPPGGKSEIKVTFDSRARGGDQDKQIGVLTNDPTQNKITLRLHGTIKVPPLPIIQLLPWRIDFEAVTTGQEVTRSFTIRNSGVRDLIVLQALASSPGLSVSLAGSATLPPEGKIEVQVRMLLPADHRSGYVEMPVVIKSNDPNSPEIRVTCVAFVKGTPVGKLVVPGGDFELGELVLPDTFICKVPISNGGNAPITIARVEVAGSAARIVGAEGLVLAPRATAEVEVRTAFNLVQGTFRDRVMVAIGADTKAPQTWQEFYITGYVPKTIWK